MLLSKLYIMYEFKQFVDDRFEESLVGFQEAGVLFYYIYDVGGYNGFVIFFFFFVYII